MLKGIKLRLYPNKTQQGQLLQMFGNDRFVWNQMLAMMNERYKNNKDLPFLGKFKLAENQLNDLIDNIPTSDFDDLINSKIKKQIKDAYSCDLNATDISIKIRWGEIKDLFSEYSDKSIISEYVQAKANAKGYIVSRSDATDIAKNRIYDRLVKYLKNNNQKFKILTGNDIRLVFAFDN